MLLYFVIKFTQKLFIAHYDEINTHLLYPNTIKEINSILNYSLRTNQTNIQNKIKMNQLKSITYYKLADLQKIAKEHDIDIEYIDKSKMRTKNKTKKVLYQDIQSLLLTKK